MRDYELENTVSARNQLTDRNYVTVVCNDGVKKVLFFGNSITRHSPKSEIGWEGDWGMAASSAEKDYVHLVVSELEKKYGSVDYCIASAGEWECEFWQEELLDGFYSAARSFDADIVIVRVGENVKKQDYAKHDFEEMMEKAIHYLNKNADARVVVTDPFWFNSDIRDALRNIAERNGYLFCPISDLSIDERNMAIGKFEHHGVSIHPGDLGMERIADRILKVL